MGVDLAFFCWMVGVSVAHGLRFVVYPDDSLTRKFVAGSGVAVYALVAALAMLSPDWAYGLAVLFPVAGISTVLVTGNEVDDWQMAVGVTQAAAILYVAARALGAG